MKNLELCHHHKEAWRWKGAGRVECIFDPASRDLIQIAEAGNCPKDFFNKPDELLVQVTIRKAEAEAAYAASFEAAIKDEPSLGQRFKSAVHANTTGRFGSAIWSTVHESAWREMRPDERKAIFDKFESWVRLLKLCGCGDIWAACKAAWPAPAWDAPAADWERAWWTWHNIVNVHLKKPEISLEQCRNIHRRDAESN